MDQTNLHDSHSDGLEMRSINAGSFNADAYRAHYSSSHEGSDATMVQAAPMSTPASVASATTAFDPSVAPVTIDDPAPPEPSSNLMYVLQLVTDLDECQPVHLTTYVRWGIAVTYFFLQTYITLTSTSYVSAIGLVMDKFGVDRQRATLGQSLTIIGYALGPILLSPIS